MTVYVDDMKAKFGRMTMCHMVADTSEELHAMAARIGVAARWVQKAGTAREHFDISLGMRARAVEEGAREITWRQCGAMTLRRKMSGELGRPEDAVYWVQTEMEILRGLSELSKRT